LRADIFDTFSGPNWGQKQRGRVLKGWIFSSTGTSFVKNLILSLKDLDQSIKEVFYKRLYFLIKIKVEIFDLKFTFKISRKNIMEAPPLTEEELNEIYQWVDEIPLSRPKKIITRDFSDGVLMAEIINHYVPKII